MKLALFTISLLTLSWSLATQASFSGRTGGETFYITGGSRGQLSPCGCTKPMSGGMNRLGAALRQAKAAGHRWIDVGNTVPDASPQSVLKLQTYADMLGSIGVDACLIGPGERARIGIIQTTLESLARTQPVLPGESRQLGGVRVQVLNHPEDALEGEIVLVEGPSEALRGLAQRHPRVLFITRQEGAPSAEANLVSPGSHTRGYVIARRSASGWITEARELSATLKQDPTTAKLFRTYQARLGRAGLDLGIAKTENASYAGSAACAPCHTRIYEKSSTSKHFHAYETLVAAGHSRDPDCLSCHVTGIDSHSGFRSLGPERFAHVGCESCHGPGRDHARQPRTLPMPKITESVCLNCHTPSTSPGFSFEKMWPKVPHGRPASAPSLPSGKSVNNSENR